MKKACSLLLCFALFVSICATPALAQAKTSVSYTGETPIAPKGTMAVFIAPHPDDEIFSFGVTIAANLAAGRDVTVISVTDGESSAVYPQWVNGSIPNAPYEEINGVDSTSTPNKWDFACLRRAQGYKSLQQLETATNKVTMVYLGACGEDGKGTGKTGYRDSALHKGDAQTGEPLTTRLKDVLTDIKNTSGKRIGLLVGVVPYDDALYSSQSPFYKAVIDPGMTSGFLYHFTSSTLPQVYRDHTVVGLATLDIAKSDSSIGRVYLANPYASPNLRPKKDGCAYPVAPSNKALRAKILSMRRNALNEHTIGKVSVPTLWGGIYKDSVPADYLTSSEHYRKKRTSREPDEFQRYAGTTNVQTAVLGSRSAFKKGARVAVLVSSKSPSDALLATSLAGTVNGPILFTKYSAKGALEKDVKKELKRLKVSTIYIVGGEKVVSKKTASSCAKVISGKKTKVVRLAGANKYETSLKVSKKVIALSRAKKKPVRGIFVVSGGSYLDASGSTSVVAQKHMPIILVPPKGCSSETLKELRKQFKSAKITGVYVVGSKKAVSNKTVSKIKSVAPKKGNVKSVRFVGKNRADTARVITNWFIKNGGIKVRTFAVAESGKQEGFAAAAAMAKKGGLVIFTSANQLPSATKQLIKGNKTLFLNPATKPGYEIHGSVKSVGIMPEEEIHTLLLSLQ